MGDIDHFLNSLYPFTDIEEPEMLETNLI